MEKKPLVIALESTERFHRVLPGVPVTCGMKSGLVRLERGESVGEHTTGEREEAVIVLQGRARVNCFAAGIFDVAAGSLIYIPPTTRHDVVNTDSALVEYVYVVAPVQTI